MRRAAAAVIAGAAILVLAPDCAVEVGSIAPAEGAGEPEGAVIGAAVWELTWDRSRVVADGRGSGWSVENDLGYRVHVGAGWLVDHSVSLGPCVVPQPDGGAAWLPIRVGVRAAYAHDDADASAIEAMHAEDLTHLQDSGPWPSVFPKARYCRAHWLLARATKATDAPEGVDLSQTSIRVAGTWERDGEAHPFSVDTWWPQGSLQDLDGIADPTAFAEARADGETRWAWITVRRRLGVIFDGIDFAVDSDDQVAGKLVDNLVSHAEMRMELRRPNGT